MRGNGQIIQELEAIFRGAGWNVIKVIWGSDWDPLLAADHDGLLAKRMGEIVDGQYQKYAVEDGAYIREHFFGADPRLLDMVKHLSDDQLKKLRLGGHDPVKVYTAYKAAVEHQGAADRHPRAHDQGLRPRRGGRRQEHHPPAEEAERVGSPHRSARASAFRSPTRRSPTRRSTGRPRTAPSCSTCASGARRSAASCRSRSGPRRAAARRRSSALFEEFYKGTDGRKASTTMVFVRILSKLLRDKEIGKLIVPIVPDEARTFGMESLFRAIGIYSHVGQKYEPVDMDTLLYYKEAQDGQILEEGITEAGSMSSFIAAGTAYATHGVNTIPFFIYYSMFGFQRVGDLIWAGADSRVRGFLLGAHRRPDDARGRGAAAPGRPQPRVLAARRRTASPTIPAYAYELAVIIQDGIRRMYREQESIFYYLTVMNEQYAMPAMPDGARDGILKGMYRLQPAGQLRRRSSRRSCSAAARS